MQTAKFTMVQGMECEPAFNQMAKHVLKRHERILALVRKRQARFLKRNHKFGIEFLKTVE